MLVKYLVPALLLAAACVGDRPDTELAREDTDTAPADERDVVLFVGTSLTAGLGLDISEAYPALIQAKIDSAGLEYRVVNAGVSGETSAGARRRIDWLFRRPVSVLVLETGANDGLRGLNPDSLRANIQAIIDQARGLDPAPEIVLVGMLAPPNLGPAYTRRFRQVYPELARRNDVALVPFLLEGVAGVDSLNQADAIHPTAAGQRLMAATVWEVLEPILLGGQASPPVMSNFTESPESIPTRTASPAARRTARP